MFKKLSLSLALAALFAAPAYSQSIVDVVSQTCNADFTECKLQGSDGKLYIVNPVAATMVEGTTNYTGTKVYTTEILTNYKYQAGVVFTFTPTATLDATYSRVRSGSGKGGWTWHTHWVFDSITLY